MLAGVAPDMLIYREERSLRSGTRARRSPWPTTPITGYVYTRDMAKAFRMFEGLKFGIVGINDINPTAAAAPFGGSKESGLGRDGGHEGSPIVWSLGGFSI